MSTYSDSKFERASPDYPITSLQQVISVYGRLKYLSLGISSFDGYQPYYTPEEVDDSASVVVAEIDLTGDTMTTEKVEVRGIEPGELVGQLGYSYYYAARGHDYSFTHKTTSGSSSTIANWLSGGATSWAPPDETPEYDKSVTDNHPDGWIVEELAEASESEVSDLKSRVEQEASSGGEDKLLTARFRLPTDRVDQVADTVDDSGETLLAYPGELDVCNSVMKAARITGYTTMSSVDGVSSGYGADMNSGDTTELVGFATDHLKHFTTKQREPFSGFDAKQAWQVHPVSTDEALYLDKAGDYLDACYSSFGTFRVYHLPYFRGHMSAVQTRALYDFLQHLSSERDSETDRRASALTHFRDFALEYDAPEVEDIRFWTVFQNYEQKDRRDVLHEAPALTVDPSEDLAQKHLQILLSDIFGDDGLPYSTGEYTLTDPDRNSSMLASHIESGWYFTRTFPEYISGSENDASPATDDPRPRITAELLAGGTVDVDMLLAEYIEKLSNLYDGDGQSILYRLSEQTSQLKSLAAAGMLEASNPSQNSLTKPPDMPEDNTVGEANNVSAEEAILGTDDEATDDSQSESTTVDTAVEYIERTPALNESEDRAAAFLLGYTTGMMSRYQAGAEDMTRTFSDQYPAHNLTTTGAKRLFSELQGKAVAYADGAGSVYQSLIGELTDASPRTPDEWNLSLVDIRFHYGEGVALALNAD